VLAVRLDNESEPELVQLTWGLLPFWAKESKLPYSTINAWAETVAEKSAYRQPSENTANFFLRTVFMNFFPG
jgi:putative SOS response-associated peptidase YedK